MSYDGTKWCIRTVANRYTIGYDYGTNSVRALAVDIDTGEEVATAVFNYPSGKAGLFLSNIDPLLTRQNPADYITGFVTTTRDILKSIAGEQVIGLGFDTTGSSPMPIDKSGTPICQLPGFANDLDSYVWIWKDHTAHDEAVEITQLSQKMGLPYMAKYGGKYSSEWFWSKILHCARTSPLVFEQAYSWAEICDWIPAFLSGNQAPDRMKRSVCAAAHKAIYAEEWGGLPSEEFLAKLDPRLKTLRLRLYHEVYTSDKIAGYLTPEFAQATGLPPEIPLAVGAFDAHLGAVASCVAPNVLVKIMGTSTCDCMVHPLNDPLPDIPGLCGIVKESILPGYYGLEAGQSAVGDIFNWVSHFSQVSHEKLTQGASKLQPGQSGLMLLDWHNGNRTVLVDQLLTGVTIGQTLATTPADLYRAAIEATAFGSLKIIDRMEEYGAKVDQVVACGGIAEKSTLAMQIYADVFNRPVWIAASSQTCALGSAIVASVAAQAFPSIEKAQAQLARLRPKPYVPNPEAVETYKQLYKIYLNLHDAFGLGEPIDLGETMKSLIAIREEITERLSKIGENYAAKQD